MPPLLRALRPHQWVKNLLVFLPVAMAHRVGETGLWMQAGLAFAALSLAASGVYVTNDVLDVESDRRHPTKQLRPFASGALPLSLGWILGPMLWLGALGLGLGLPRTFLVVLGLYIVTSTAYSLRLKRVMALDVIVLAGLYALRLVAGGTATGITVSPWLLGFSLFFFLSIAVLKRYSELDRLQLAGTGTEGSRRGYKDVDMEVLRGVGPTSGYIAVLVFVLYINSDTQAALYRRPIMLWLIAPLLLYWITRIWILAHRRQVHDDPIVFAVRDRLSYLVGLFVLLLAVLAV